jgi:hypothetical protein
MVFITVVMIFCCMNAKLSSAARDGKPFIHKFGELRVYYKDWLVVCGKNGEGACRMVAYNRSGTETFFGRSALTVFPEQDGVPAHIEFYCSGAPKLQKTPVKIKIGEMIADLQPGVDIFDADTMETYDIRGDAVHKIVEMMKVGRFISIHYGEKGVEKEETFSLRGAAKSLSYIADRLSQRHK